MPAFYGGRKYKVFYMAKFRFDKRKTRKAVIAALCAVTVACTALAACQPSGSSSDDDEDKKPNDTQLLSNGNFEFFTVPKKGVYLIKNVTDWSRSGDSSGTKSGIVGTSENQWKALTASDLADKLDKNNDLSSSDDEYVDYNGMKSVDIPYRDTYAARVETGKVKSDTILNKNDLTYAEFLGIDVEGEDTKTYKYKGETVYYNADDGDFYFDAEFKNPVRLDTVANPETHYGAYKEEGGKHYLGDKEIYVDDDGNYYSDEKKEYSEGNVLMIHNYPTDTKYNGIAQYFSSNSVTLPAHTAAKISLWVKTSDLKFDKGYSLMDEQDRGAFIEVVQTVGGTTIDNFTIKAINTEKIISTAKTDGDSLGSAESNGWLQYNIYVNACDFAESTVQLRLGLGKSDGETCTGYAFFDDVKVEKQLNIDDFTEYKDSVQAEIETNKTSCTIASEENEKVFYADKEMRGASGADRHSKHFNYSIDLASETGAAAADANNHYTTFVFDGNNVTAGLTTEKEDKVTYATAKTYNGKTAGGLNVAATDYSLYKKNEERITTGDLLGVFATDGDFAATGISSNHSAALAGALLNGDNAFSKLPTFETGKSNSLVMLSSYGAAYTSTISDSDVFKLDKDECMIVSFWVKTSDMKSKTAATFTVYDAEDTEKENAQNFSVDTTNVTTDIDDNKDIYHGWVQCFFFVQNNSKSNGKEFKIDFSFGNTSVISATSYDGGYAAVANLQTLKIPEKICNLTPTANYTKKFQFATDESETEKNKLSDPTGTSDISKEIAQPDKYYGVNGGSSSVSDADYRQSFDVRNTNKQAGLINSDKDGENIPAHVLEVLKSFNSSATNWSDVFTDECYQPLIIVNALRKYADKADATEDTFKTGNYYIAVDGAYDGGDVVTDNSGNKYRPVTDSDVWDKDETYYSFKEVCNYGFIGNDDTVDANGLKAISVKVMVSGNATAYIYLVDPDTREVMGYTAPNYTFYYDDEGNVLKTEFDKDWKASEREENTAYELQDNGLYKDKDGKLHANLWNLKRIYLKDKFKVYYDINGNEVRSSRFEDGVDYYVDSAHTKLAPHRLCNDEDKPIYEYTDEYDGGNPVYYYMVNGKKTTTKVENFDASIARYDYRTLDEKYVVEVGNTNGKWETVNFIIKAGNEAKPYRIELWSGKRGETGVDLGYREGAVAFDYSSCGITSSNFESVLRTDTQSYENKIIAQYQELLKGHEEEFEKDGTIKDYEELAAKYLAENADYETLKNSYTAKYYTYSLYDDTAFIPYNKEVAEEGETGYDYTAPESESLAYFATTSIDGGAKTHNVFADYSAVDQEIKYVAPDDDTDDGDDTDQTNAGEFWLQLASILLVVVLLFVLLALVARNVLKKVKRNKNIKAQSKNVYKKRERYMRKLHIEEEETEEVENPALENNNAEEPAEAQEPAEAPAESEAQEPATDEPAAETETPAEENAADEPATDGGNAEDGDKQ